MLEKMIPNDWKILLKSEFEKPYFKQLNSFLKAAYKKENIYPPKNLIFKALELTSFKKCKILILGQDPYYNEHQANGLAFSVNENIKPPPSLKNILKEVENTTNFKKTNPNLESWAKQGVLLINSILTVKANSPKSHNNIGWQQFTDKIVELLNNKKKPIVFLLWGNFAKSKSALISNKIHLKLETSHPSPLSARQGFLGCDHFNIANQFLKQTNQSTIDWTV